MKWPSGQNLPRTHAKPTFSEAWFPTTVLDLMINVYDAGGMSREVIRDVIADMVRAAQPSCYVRDVWLADVGPDVPDEVIASFVEAVDRAFTGNRD